MNRPVRVLVVDDSAFMRRVLTSMLERDPEIQVVGFARSGAEALEKIPLLRPQVVTLDVEMPGLNGLETLERIICTYPLPVVMVSALTTEGAEATIRALELGAVDFVAKPARQADLGLLADDLPAKVKAVAGVQVSKVCRLQTAHLPPAGGQIAASPRPMAAVAGRAGNRLQVVGLGTSTGGPSALHTVVTALPDNLPVGILIVQHMPPGFTRPLAQRLNDKSKISVKEAEAGDVVKPGTALVAPAGQQLHLEERAGEVRVVLDYNSPVDTLFKPSVDVMLLSVAKIYGASALGVILTGMGNDGLRGIRAIKEKGGRSLAEAESTCVVYGMPKAVVEAGLADKVVPLPQMAAEIVAALG